MKINFNLPGLERNGGVRVIFEVANLLQDRGHDVTITAFGNPDDKKWFPLKVKVVYVEVPLLLKAFRKAGNQIGLLDLSTNWDHGYENLLTKAIPDCDINVATSALTAYPTLRSKKGKMFYYIQHYEPLFFSDKKTIMKAKTTYKLPLKKMVISKWLGEVVKIISGEYAVHISNGINLNVFYPRIHKNHDKKIIMSLFRNSVWKGDKDALSALNQLSKRMSGFKLCYIGDQKKFNKFTSNMKINFDVDFVNAPCDDKLAELYNTSNVFLSPSWTEGFPLPPLEAMACGTPLVTTNNLGVQEYAVNGYNSLVTPLRNIEKMSDALYLILNNPNIAKGLSENGVETSKKYKWDNVVDKLEKAFTS